jgi:hypothetical protein
MRVGNRSSVVKAPSAPVAAKPDLYAVWEALTDMRARLGADVLPDALLRSFADEILMAVEARTVCIGSDGRGGLAVLR